MAGASSQHGGWVPRVNSPRERAWWELYLLMTQPQKSCAISSTLLLGQWQAQAPTTSEEEVLVTVLRRAGRMGSSPTHGHLQIVQSAMLFCCWLLAQSCLTLCDPPGSMTGFFRQEQWSGLPFPSPGIFLTQGSTCISCSAGKFFTTEPPNYSHSLPNSSAITCTSNSQQ